jgi:hypothetical protein
MNGTGITVRWKEHQSADSSSQILIMCVPNIFDKEGLKEELLFHMKAVERKMVAKEKLPASLLTEPIPLITMAWQQNKQGRGRNQEEQQLSLNSLDAFNKNRCLVLSIKTAEGTWEQLGPLWKMLNKMGLIRTIFGHKAMMVVMYGGRATDSDRNTIQGLRRCNVIYLHHLTHTILPHIVLIHKQVEIRMEDPTTKAPH